MRIEPALLAGFALLTGANAVLSGEQHQEHGHHRHHHDVSRTLGAFHDLMEPLWHSRPGAMLVEQTCAVSTEIVGKADAIAAAPRGPDFSEAARGLQRSAQSLQQACERGNTGTVERELSALHAHFHRLASTGER